ncbi:GRF1-interacting factor 1-like isoform X2 [Ananas comosus]|uniref:GRF1-interacting factor 1 n=1 Tax=Ananas comosus TaxID=4615 RepID=A0A199W7Q4_ANACO|nr:GRF1-interacting factor 1-like isoform X2 [Ananas comosus]OAY84945.1 GRF1-interacting factor 1 [Ananas comosus]
MQQHLMQMQQPIMAAYASPNQVTTDIIQQYLDENKQLILAILDNQSSGKAEECAQNQARLQRNLMYLAAIADSQPQVPTAAQHLPNSLMQQGSRYMQHPQAQQMTPQSLLAARSSMLYAQSPMSVLQQQQQQAALHGHFGMAAGGSSGGFNMLHGESGGGGNGALAPGVFPNFGRSGGSGGGGGVGKQEAGNAMPIEGHGGDAAEPMYLKGSEEEAN